MPRDRRPSPSGLLLLAAALALALAWRCGGPPPLAPIPGLPEHLAPAVVPVPGGQVVAAGGSLRVSRVDLSLDTRLGTRNLGASYDSATGAWLWSFEIRYDGATFLDPTGAVHDLAAVPDGAVVPGTSWVRLDARTLRTKGGLVHRFAADGRLAHVRFASSAWPRLQLEAETVAGAARVVRIVQCTAAASCTPAFELDRDAAGRVVGVTDRAGRQAEFVWDAQGRLVGARDGLDVARGWPGFRYSYDGTRLVGLTSSEGESVAFRYAGGRVAEVEALGAEHPIWRFAYLAPSGGLHTTVATDPTGVVTRFTFDGFGRVREVRDGAGDVVRLAWSGLRVASRELPDGATTRWSWQDGDIVTRTDPSGNVSRFTWAAHGVNRDDPFARALLRLEDDLGVIEERSYDAAGRLRSVRNGAGETWTLDYDAEEMLDAVVSPAGLETRFADHGAHGHPARVEGPLGVVPYAYDAVGNLVAGPSLEGEGAPALGGVFSRSFDADRNVAEVRLFDSAAGAGALRTLTVTHRSDGRRLAIARPYGGDVEFVYDAVGRLVERREKASGTPFAAWQSTRFEHDAAGRRRAMERPNGMREEWRYDAAGRLAGHLILRDGALDGAAAYSYAAGRLARIDDAAHLAPERYAYDDAGRVLSVEHPDGGETLYGYDARSRLVTTAYLDGALGFLRALRFGYDGADREVSVRDGEEPVLERLYERGRLARVRTGNGLERTWSYDAETGLPSAVTMVDAAGATVEEATLGYTAACPPPQLLCPEVTTRTYGAVEATTHESFVLWDALGEGGFQGLRLLLSHHGAPGAPVQRRRSLLYDALSSTAVREQDPGPVLCGSTERTYHYAYNPERNRLREMRLPACATPVHAYAYDEAGFATERDGVELTWDGAGRIVAVGDDEFSWDALGRPVSRTVDGVTTRLRFGGVLEATPGGVPVALDLGDVRVDLTTGQRLYRHHDFRHNVKLVTDDAGDVVVHYRYHGFGVDAVLGSDADTHERFAQGRALGGLVLLGHRLYDPEAERFLAPDPIYQLINAYAYAQGNPVLFWDPTGMELSVATIVSGIAGGVATAAGVVALIAGPTPVGFAAAGIAFAAGAMSTTFFVAETMDAAFKDGSEGAGSGSGSAGGTSGAGSAAGSGGESRGAKAATDVSGTRIVSGSYGLGPARWHGPPSRPATASSGGSSRGGLGDLGQFGGLGSSGCFAPVVRGRPADLSLVLVVLVPALALAITRRQRAIRQRDDRSRSWNELVG